MNAASLGVGSYVRPLTIDLEANEAGHKASTLSRIGRLGLTVPPAFAITTAAFNTFIAFSEIAGPMALLRRELDCASGSVSRIAEEIRALVMSSALPTALRDELLTCRATLLPPGPLAVRSSAVGEDSAAASFAGQLDSFLGVQTDEALERAVLGCWGSYWSARAVAYQRARGIRLAGMGVIVQMLVPSVVSGVLFTRSPEPTHRNDLMLVECCSGHGDRLAAGAIDPERLVIARSGPSWWWLGTPHSLLGDAQVAMLRRAALTLESAFRAPQDIEWTMDADGQLHVIQSRPITVEPAVGRWAKAPRATAGADARPIVWSNANINENFPGPVTPLLYSIAAAGYAHYFANLARAFGITRHRVRGMEYPLRHIVGVHCARLYYHLDNIHAVLRMAPGGEWLIDAFNRFVGTESVGGASCHAGAWGSDHRNRFSRLLELAVMGGKVTWQYLFLTRRVERFERTVAAFAAKTHPDELARRSLSQLLAEFLGFLDIRCHRWTDAALADAGSMVSYGMLRRALATHFPEPEEAALPTTLLKGFRDIVSAQPALRLWDLSCRLRADHALERLLADQSCEKVLARIETDPVFAELRRELHDFLESWGFRCSGELMLTVPSFQERPAALLDLVRAYLDATGETPPERLARQEAERREETSRVLGILRRRRLLRLLPWPTAATLVSLLLRWTHTSVALRERARLQQSLLYSRCRRIVLAIGDRLAARGVLGAGDDVFFLTIEELDALVSGHAMFPDHVRALVALRRQAHADLGALTPPDTVLLAEGDYLSSIAAEPIDLTVPRDGLAGVSACGGRVEGRAAVLDTLADAATLQAGDILVTRQTDPGWAPVFLLIRGLVLERGGMLSHGAIIAREYGIPSVVGVPHATQRIAHGSRVSVDGDRGRVDVLA
jgi:pyruvate,water dikinase